MTNAKNSDIEPPDKLLRILKVFCPEHLIEEIEGDLVQRFQRDLKNLGKRRATNRLLWSVLRFFRLGIILRNRFSIDIIRYYMLRNHIKIAFRNFARQKPYTILNIVGLS